MTAVLLEMPISTDHSGSFGKQASINPATRATLRYRTAFSTSLPGIGFLRPDGSFDSQPPVEQPFPRDPMSRNRRPSPSWACARFVEHGEGELDCPDCLTNFVARGSKLETWDHFPPRVQFQRGWLTLGATHWFEAADGSVFVARDGRRVLAQAICGQICDVTMTWAPMMDWRKCTKCLRALGLAESTAAPVQPVEPDSAGIDEEPPSESASLVRLYRGLTETYDPDRPPRDQSGTDFTDCPLAALSYAKGSKGVVLVIGVDTSDKRVHEGLWVGPKIKRYLVRKYQDFVVAVIPAKELRAQIRRKGVASTTDDYKAEVLRAYIEQRVNEG